MKLSQSVTYAVHAVLRLAENRNSGPISCARLAELGNMPERFLLQILRDLAKQGILISYRGGRGGFTLEREPEAISLLEMIEAIDGPMTSGVPMKNNFPGQTGDKLQMALHHIAEQTRKQLEAIRLSDLISGALLARLE